jgi:hypothetical protein
MHTTPRMSIYLIPEARVARRSAPYRPQHARCTTRAARALAVRVSIRFSRRSISAALTAVATRLEVSIMNTASKSSASTVIGAGVGPASSTTLGSRSTMPCRMNGVPGRVKIVIMRLMTDATAVVEREIRTVTPREPTSITVTIPQHKPANARRGAHARRSPFPHLPHPRPHLPHPLLPLRRARQRLHPATTAAPGCSGASTAAP